MENDQEELYQTVIANKYCIGCGVCAASEDSPFDMAFNEKGQYQPVMKERQAAEAYVGNLCATCPFSDQCRNETEIAASLFGGSAGITFNDYTGYYLNTYGAYVKGDAFREKGSSGGMGNWIAAKLLEDDLVDAIIHVKEAKDGSGRLFSYQVSTTVPELLDGAKSKYYPIELSAVIKQVMANPGRYAIFGIPCFIKSVRLLAEKNRIFDERIIFTIGLVCGHLKSDQFAKSIGWQMGIEPDKLTEIDFRQKIPGRKSSDYGVEVSGEVAGQAVTKTALTRDLYTTHWGDGLFKYTACDYCDDVLAETADVTIGDAWLPEYEKDSNGTNIVVVRNQIIQDVIDRHREELFLEALSMDKVYQSQAGGFRHRRQGLAYRLYLKDKKGEWRPQKRVQASADATAKRKKIYVKRMALVEESYRAYEAAVKAGDFQYFITYMNPILKDYQKVNDRPFVIRALGKVKRIFLDPLRK
ncbi:Hypothetical protein Tpal_2066 [Trichococcus palustris]|uniref:Uncharacterized protein n=1 Tax=Trichococcus palustris TaxID=140314 RepID=A0A143YVH8_9LACT|nr:Coenzyme F420 hydrogenase/dehydrogenase, beta subunit C-terminal domain [Trichococcus palustris]CZQ96893.1 Hypothetical protein Tpal_2066 [Trichococcus palustris]SFK74804.1 Coenzyme F420-reducing hydrogenase, beta subunit [Trichococcus palustris]